jgi:dTDP-4-dehydrorhamnose 3,5-epimerase
MPFDFKSCEIEGLWEIQPKVFGDNRGYFLEIYSKEDFFDAGLTMEFVQDNQSASKGGVLRGLHFQTLHPQGKLVSVLEGKVFDVAVDLRCDSETFGKYYGVELSSEKHSMFYIPQGFAHGFYVISDFAVFSYKCTDFYHPEDEGGLMWNDPEINIDWKNLCNVENPILSEKDLHHPQFNKEKKYFNKNGLWIN